jgi:hypothetical protein
MSDVYTIPSNNKFEDVLHLLIHQFKQWRDAGSLGCAQMAFVAYFTQVLCPNVLSEFENKGMRLILQEDDDEDDDEVKYFQYRLTKVNDIVLHHSLYDFA